MENLKKFWNENDWVKAIIILILYLGFAFYLGQFWILLSIAVSFIWLIISRKKDNSQRLLPATILLLGIITLFIPNPLHNHNSSQNLKDIPSGFIQIPDIVSNDKETAQAYLEKAGIKSTFISVTSSESGIAPGKVSYDDGQPGVKTFHCSDYKMRDSNDLEETFIKKGETLIVKVADKEPSSTPATPTNPTTSSAVIPNSSTSENTTDKSSITSDKRTSDDSGIKTLLYLQSKTVIQQKQNITGIKINNSPNDFVFVDNDGSGKSWLVTGQFNWQGETHYFTINFLFNKDILDKSVSLINNAELTYDVQQITVQ